MKRNDSLFRLIRSLSKSEKRFFKIYSERHVIGDQNNYVALFDTIDRQKNYNEEAIIKKFADRKFARRLPVAKNYLYELILKSMNQYHAQGSIDAELRELLGNVQFLYNKGLFDQAEKTIVKAKRLATDYEKLAVLPDILQWQKKIMEAQSYLSNMEGELNEIYTEQTNVANQLKNLNEYWFLQAQIYYQHTHKGMLRQREDLNKIEQLIAHPLLQNEALAQTFESKLLLYKIQATYHFILRNFEQCYVYSQKTVELLQSRPELLQLDPLHYINSLNNLLNIIGMLGKDTERQQYIGQLKNMLHDKAFQNPESVQIKLFEAYYYHLMTWHISQNTFEQCLPNVLEMEQKMQQYDDQLDQMGRTMLCFYAFHIAFGSKNYAYSYQWLQKIADEDRSQIRQDIYDFAQILQLVAAYEMDDAVLLRQKIRSIYRFLLQKERIYQSETLLLQWLKQTARSKQTDVPILLQHFTKQLNQLLLDPQERRILAYFDFSGWLAKIITKR